LYDQYGEAGVKGAAGGGGASAYAVGVLLSQFQLFLEFLLTHSFGHQEESDNEQ